MSDREPGNTPAQDMHRAIFAAIKGMPPDEALAALGMSVAEVIVAHVPEAQRPRELRRFDEAVRGLTRQLGEIMAAMFKSEGR